MFFSRILGEICFVLLSERKFGPKLYGVFNEVCYAAIYIICIDVPAALISDRIAELLMSCPYFVYAARVPDWRYFTQITYVHAYTCMRALTFPYMRSTPHLGVRTIQRRARHVCAPTCCSVACILHSRITCSHNTRIEIRTHTHTHLVKHTHTHKGKKRARTVS